MKTYSDSEQRKNFQIFYEPIEMPGGYKFDHAETLKLTDLYYNSKFKSGQYDKLGYRKFFYNIVKPACDIATKFVDLDTKDIILIPEGGSSELTVWMMQRKLKQWLKDEHFGSLLNDIAENYPKYGSVVVKMTKEGPELKNLHTLRMDPTVCELEDSGFVYDLERMAREDIDEMDWDKDAVAELYARDEDCQFFDVYDCYDKTSKGWHRTVKADLFSKKGKNGINRAVESEINQKVSYFGSVTLFEEDVKDLPYRELHWEKVPGRWLGRGFVEYLEENQVATNETENLERKAGIYNSLKLFQTRDQSVAGSNILSSSQNGDIIQVESEITPIAMEERNLAANNATRENWRMNTEKKTFTTDITTGANLPSRTPLGVANLQASFATSYFELKRENFGLFLKELILNDIIPSFQNQNSMEHILTFAQSDEELDRLDSTITEIMTNEAVVKFANKTGFYPSQIQREDLKARILNKIKSEKHRFIKVPKNSYKNVKYILDVNITGEAIDNGAKSQVIQFALQIVGTNPGILQNPAAKNMMFKVLALGGVSPAELGLLDTQPQGQFAGADQSAPPQVAGSLAKQAPMMAQVGKAAKTL